MMNQAVRKTTLRHIIADERGVNVVEYVAVTGIALMVAGMIIVAIMNSRMQIGRIMAQVHARQVASFEGGGGGSVNINAALTPKAPVPSIPQATWPTLAIPGIIIEVPTTGTPPINAPCMPQPIPEAPAIPQPPIAAPLIPLAAPVTAPVISLPAMFTTFGGDTATAVAMLLAGSTMAAFAAIGAYTRQAASASSGVPAWLAALGEVLLGVLVGVVALVALAAIIYFGAAALAAIGIGTAITFAAALLIAGIVLAVGFTLFEFWNRLQEYRAAKGEPGFWDYLKIAGLSIASLTGVPQIIEAIRGSRLLTDLPLSAQQRWELGLGGVLQLALVALGVRVAGPRIWRWLTGKPEPVAPTAPTTPETPPVRPPLEEPPPPVVETPAQLMRELADNGVKFTPDAIVRIERMPDGQIVFLEQGKGGSRGAGLAHILEQHASDFARRGISPEQIPDLIMEARQQNKIVGYQGTRPIYEVLYNGQTQYVAITIGNNGFIVGANPATWP